MNKLVEYYSFEGRALRAEWWTVYLVSLAASSLAGLLFHSAFHYVIYVALGLAALATSVRRLHDLGVSGWFSLLNVIPVVGPLALVVWLGFFPSRPASGITRF